MATRLKNLTVSTKTSTMAIYKTELEAFKYVWLMYIMLH